MKKILLLALTVMLIFTMTAFPVAAADSSASPNQNEPRNIFSFGSTEIPEIYLTNQSSPIYMMLPSSNPAHAEIMKALASTKVVSLNGFNADSGVDAGFFVISRSGKKMINLRPGGIIEVNGEAYGTTAKQYNLLSDLGNDDYKGLKPIAQWCAFMSYPNIVKVEYSPSPGKSKEIPVENVRTAAKELHGLTVKSGKVIFPGSVDLENWPDRTKVVYTFENGTQYKVYANNSFLFIESKGMTYSCQYTGDYTAYVARVKELASRPVKSAAPSTEQEIKQPKNK